MQSLQLDLLSIILYGDNQFKQSILFSRLYLLKIIIINTEPLSCDHDVIFRLRPLIAGDLSGVEVDAGPASPPGDGKLFLGLPLPLPLAPGEERPGEPRVTTWGDIRLPAATWRLLSLMKSSLGRTNLSVSARDISWWISGPL